MDNDYRKSPFHETPEQQAFMAAWQHEAKQIERLCGVGLIFAGAALVMWDAPTDPTLAQVAILVAALLFSGGITLLLRSRRPAQNRLSLRFLNGEKNSRRATMAGFGAAFLLFRGVQMMMPFFIVLALVLAGAAIWLRWRAQKITAYDALSTHDAAQQSETEAEVEA